MAVSYDSTDEEFPPPQVLNRNV